MFSRSPLTASAGRPSPSVHGRASACEPRAPHEQPTCVSAQIRTSLTARALSLSREEAQQARLRRAGALPRWLESVHILWKPTAPAGRPSPTVYDRASACEPRAPHEQPTCVSAQVRTAPTARARSLSGGSAARALATCGGPTALVGVGPYRTKDYCTSETTVSLDARPYFGLRAACSTRAADLRECPSQNCANRARSRSLSGGSAARALATCGRPAALVEVNPCSLETYCASGTAVSLGTRPCFGVRAACSTRASDLRECASQNCANRARSLSLLGGSAARVLATYGRPAALVGVGSYPLEAYCARWTAVSHGLRPCFGVRAMCSTQAGGLRECASQNCANRACSRSLSGGSAACAHATCGRPAALVGVGPCSLEAHLLRQQDGRLHRCTAVLRRASRVLHTSSRLA